MIIKIVFYKSSSQYYESLCESCRFFETYEQEKSTNTLTLGLDDLREKQQNIKSILTVIKSWSKTEYYINGNRASFYSVEAMLALFECEKRCSECVISNEYCYDETGWGCRYINSIALRRASYYHRSNLNWYEFGRFQDDVWIVDKDRILEQLKKEVAEKHVEACKFFALSRLESALLTLPEKIIVTDDDSCEWEYKYREAPVGMKQTEVIGVRPHEDHSYDYGGGLGISVSMRTSSERGKQQENDEKNVPSVTFSDIGGIDDIIQQVREVIELPLIAPTIFEHYHIKPHKGILLYGPPGCGKTLIAKAVANEINAHFISVNGPEILNKYVGQSEANLRKLFDEAKRNNPTIIYFDEFDSISSTRDADGNPLMATVVNQLLTLMDGIDDTSQVCAIASTNRIDMIDEAVRRPGRFDYVIEIQRPSIEGCKTIFRIHTEKMPVDASFDKESFVSKYLMGCSGAEIAFVASEAAYNSIRRTVDIKRVFQKDVEFCVSDKNIILECDFIKAAKTLIDSRKKADTAKYRYNN